MIFLTTSWSKEIILVLNVDYSDVTIIESEISIAIFFGNQIESKSIFWLVFIIDFDSRLYWWRQRTAASSKHDSQSRGVLNTRT